MILLVHKINYPAPVTFHSCCNRSCPKCHAGNTQKWLEKKESSLLSVPYFHVVFTLPGELRLIVRSNQKELLNCLFKAAKYSLFKLMRDPRFVGGTGTPGMLAVLHTWTRDMNYHPHLHCLVPAGVISEDGLQWLPIKKKKFLVPINILSSLIYFSGTVYESCKESSASHKISSIPMEQELGGISQTF